MNKKKNKMVIAITAIIVVAITLLGSFDYFGFFKQEEKAKKEEMPEVQIDDRTSPHLNQGLTVQIKRIRNRGLMDKMLEVGTSWRKTPTFYWVVSVDGKEHNSAEIFSAAGIDGEGEFTMWDNFGHETKGNFYVKDGQETSKVIITIFEKVKSGLSGRNVQDVEKEKIVLTYNYRSGKWSGDDNFKDSDGYGHVRSEVYDVWFDLKPGSDYDHDGIPYWTEVNILRTDPMTDDTYLDPDEDGIPTVWEWKWGYDPNTWDDHIHLDPDIDGIENIEEYQMRKYFADPYQPDIYIEIDGMEKGRFLDTKHNSYEETHQMLIERFAQHGINVYIDYGWPDGPVNGGGEKLEYMKVNDDTVGHHHSRFYHHNFADERKGIFRYCMVAVNAGFISPGGFNHYDHIVVDSGFYVTLKRNGFTARYRRVLLAKGILHELGHSLGLMPTTFTGVDVLTGDKEGRWPTQLSEEEYEKYCEQYYSIMNYGYIFGPLSKQRKLFDYSNGSNGAPYDQNDWDFFYLPAFQIDQAAYEEAQPQIDNSIEDQEVVLKNIDLEIAGWEYDENLTNEYMNELSSLTFVSNADCHYKIYLKTDEELAKQESNRNVRVYSRPKVDPTITVWSLVAEGKLDKDENTLEFYSYDNQYTEIMDMLSE